MKIGIDFGTSNTSVALATAEGGRLIALEGDATSIPTAIFYGASLRDVSIGQSAMDAYEDGDEGRLMRSIKSVLGSSLIDDTTQVANRRLPFRQVITDFLKHVVNAVETSTGQPIGQVIQGRPVSFNDDDKELDKRAQVILEACLHDAGVSDVAFLPEPVAAARSVSFPTGREKLIFVADIGGGTSDFSIVRISGDNQSFEVLGSTGIYFGGNDFDRILSFSELTPLFGRNETLELNGLPTPVAPYAMLSDWKSLNKLYTRDFARELEWMIKHSPQSKGLKAFDYLVDNYEAHLYAHRTEALKIELSQTDEGRFVYDALQIHLEKQVSRQTFETLIEETVSGMDRVAQDCLKQAGVIPGQITDIVMVGGSTFIPLVEERFSRQFRHAEMSSNDRFGAVAKGLALYSASNM